ncbi:hypothetical protein [Bradyrhizobium sp. AUGA SZCCT0182]|uniref:hypothetical protein n=1 Tax=Bradyrhizobium sp. AUGA SZCCT0182 TaxID=2807667 RepID=UPI001BAD4EEF|nr:hypothetical protein [Bradyrhizobium sp. AUGA SZCCT0182]MBR1235372.1 hypothetical protein [Bradyrhizobium sp. AUGA SZCCT0182]
MAREGRSEIERALTGRRPKLVADLDLHGILHCHTDTSAPRRWRRRSGSKPRATTWSRQYRPRSGSAPLLGQAKDGDAGRILHKSTTGNAALCTRLTSTHPSLRSDRHGAPALLEMRPSKPGLAGPIRQVSREADGIRRYRTDERGGLAGAHGRAHRLAMASWYVIACACFSVISAVVGSSMMRWDHAGWSWDRSIRRSLKLSQRHNRHWCAVQRHRRVIALVLVREGASSPLGSVRRIFEFELRDLSPKLHLVAVP